MTLHHRFDGPDDAPVLVLSNSIGTTLELWDAQIPAFAGPFRVLRYDQLGHGRSEVPPGPYSVELLARELLALLDGLGVERVLVLRSLARRDGRHVARRERRRPHRSARPRRHVARTSGRRRCWIERARLVRAEGMEPIADATMGALVHPRPTRARRAFREVFVSTPAEGYAACCEALRDWDFRGDLGSVAPPTLVLVGADDPATPPETAQLIADGIPGAGVTVIPNAAHLLNVEQPAAFDEAALAHLTGEERA